MGPGKSSVLNDRKAKKKPPQEERLQCHFLSDVLAISF